MCCHVGEVNITLNAFKTVVILRGNDGIENPYLWKK
jgi:hypothetical protein